MAGRYRYEAFGPNLDRSTKFWDTATLFKANSLFRLVLWPNSQRPLSLRPLNWLILMRLIWLNLIVILKGYGKKDPPLGLKRMKYTLGPLGLKSCCIFTRKCCFKLAMFGLEGKWNTDFEKKCGCTGWFKMFKFCGFLCHSVLQKSFLLPFRAKLKSFIEVFDDFQESNNKILRR